MDPSREEQLIHASTAGQLQRVQELLKDGVDPGAVHTGMVGKKGKRKEEAVLEESVADSAALQEHDS
jgi:hypothetical protein